jgi:3-deoxy-D-manno-octulosonate 8-phosphate phosphatase (KDO 8-P phosphatase)
LPKEAKLVTKARKIKMLLMDVDGVLTDGGIIYGGGPGIEIELKKFHVQDGTAITLAHRGGLKTGIITGRESLVVARRAQELQMAEIYQKTHSKTQAFQEILARHGLKEEEVAFIGDDLIDIPVMARAGLAIAVANAQEEVKAQAHWVTKASGGQGAVREAVNFLLKAQGTWEMATQRYFQNSQKSSQ